jgi:hypothetical protein
MILAIHPLNAQAPPADKPLLADYIAQTVTALPASLQLDPFYKKYADAHGIPIVSSERVPDSALLVARDIVVHMLSDRPDVRRVMVAQHFHVGVMAQSETTTDIPEHRNMKKPKLTDPRLTTGEKANYARIEAMTDKEYWDRRARGMGGNPTTCAEENLLGYPGTRYYGENIFVHEFSHAIMLALRTSDPNLHAEIMQAYKDAMARGLYKGTYGETTANEYWAEGTQTWFWSNFEFKDGDKVIDTPDDLKNYDPKLYELLGRVYPDHHIPMDVYYGKQIKPRAPASQKKEGAK